MKIRNKIILDRIIAKPVAFLLNIIVLPLGKIFHIDHDDSPEKVKVIAIAKLLGLGSILRATPMVRALKKRYPSAKFILVTTQKNKSLVELIPLFNERFYIRDSSCINLLHDIIIVIIKLWKSRVDLYFDLEIYSAFSTILATSSLARNRYSFYRESTLFRKGLNTHMIWFNDQQHITKIYLQFAQACGIVYTDLKIEEIKLQKQHETGLREWFEVNNIAFNSPYIIINPNTSDLLLERRWPINYFAVLINALAVSWHLPIFIVGSPEERCYTDELYNKLDKTAAKITFNSAGKISLEVVVALIYKANLMITNDSGLYHIGISAGIPVISLWGPGNPAHYADIEDERNIIFRCKEIYCSPCLYRTEFPPCKGNNICMKSIPPKDVYKKACEVLKVQPNADTSNIERVYNKESHRKFDITVRIAEKR